MAQNKPTAMPAALAPYYQTLVARPSVKAALLAEGLQP